MSTATSKCVLPEWKTFLRGSEEREVGETGEVKCKEQSSLSGGEANLAYGEIIGVDSFQSVQALCKPNEPQVAVTLNNVGPLPSLNTVMRSIESNDIKSVVEAIHRDKQLISAVDSFGWSLLMCAACAGVEKAVKLLLDAGANTQIRDRQGNSCLSLAKKNGHLKIVNLILNWKRSKYKKCGPAPQSKSEQLSPSLSSCGKCRVSVQSSEMRRHLTSTVHLLNKDPMPTRVYYSIPESNRGYQLMLKTGWNRDKGLGISGDGRRFPLKTVLKKDRRGVGASKQTPRVTHFPAFDSNAVSTSCKKQEKKVNRACKGQHLRDYHRERRREQSLRKELS